MFEAHAYLAAGAAADVPFVLQLLEKAGIATSENPDLYTRFFTTLSIDDARQLIARATLRAIRKRRVFVIAAITIPVEAQNALLKTLEEPPSHALFILLHPAPDTLLPTMRSRMQALALVGKKENSSPIEISTFLKATAAKRLHMLKPLLEKGDDDVRNMGLIFSFLSALEQSIGSSQQEALHAVYRARKYSGDRGALLKPLLEQIALLV